MGPRGTLPLSGGAVCENGRKLPLGSWVERTYYAEMLKLLLPQSLTVTKTKLEKHHYSLLRHDRGCNHV